MPISRAAKRLAALTQLEGNNNEERNDWWENVLPPGQLVERLKRAQPSSSTSIVEEADNGPRHSRKSIIRSSTEDKKGKQYSSNSLPRSASSTLIEEHASSPMYLSPPSQSLSSGRMRAGTWSSQSSSYGSHPTPSTRSSISVGELSSSSSSNDETPSERRSPILGEDWSSMLHGFGDRSSGATSPTSITRSKTNRRRRFIGSDDGTGLGVNIRGAKGSVVDLDERLRQWNNGVPFNAERVSSSPSTNLRPFPSSRQSRTGSTLYDTPEHSSAEEDHHGPYYDNHRFPRTSSTRTSDTVRESVRSKAASLASAPSSRRSSITAGHAPQSFSSSRRVSFSQEVEVVQSNDVKKVQTIGRAHGRSMSTLSDKHGMGQKPIATPQTRTHASNLRAQEAMNSRGKRSTCYSAPTSPRMAALHLAGEAKERSYSKLSRETTPTSSGRSTPKTRSRKNSFNEEEDADVARLAVLSNSLGVAHTQLSSARSLAMALTRQLSAPLRPFFHLTLLVSISSVAFVALASFLFAGYMCTVWDDVNSRGKSLQNNVTSARKTLESRVQWTRKMLGVGASDEKKDPKQSSANEANPANEAGQNAPSTLTMPIRYAFALPIAVVQSFIPSITTTKSGKKDTHATHATSSAPSGAKRSYSSRRASRNDGNAYHTLPPRPPLSSLLPSIAFTIVIAFGAGLASFFANRAAAPAPAGEASHPTVSSASGRSATSGSQASIAASRRHGHHRFESSSSTTSNRMSMPVQPSSHARHRSSNSISEMNPSGRKSPYSWQEGVSAFS